MVGFITLTGRNKRFTHYVNPELIAAITFNEATLETTVTLSASARDAKLVVDQTAGQVFDMATKITSR